jgi:DNA-directed RNA polymerase subunit omega
MYNSKKGNNMARITSQRAVQAIGNQFELVLVASQRTRELMRGSAAKITTKNGKMITALKEIEQGLYTKEDYMKTVKGKR